ncbi:MAG TPA: hypothetical protein VF312_01260 [Propionibacteriaceae bacterium]
MADEDGTRARRAAEPAEDAVPSRPKRFMTPDWDDWDASSSDTPDTDTDTDTDESTPVRGGRFAADADKSAPQGPQTPIAVQGRFSADAAAIPAWPVQSPAANTSDASAWPTPTPVADEPAPAPTAPPERARHAWDEQGAIGSPDTLEQPVIEPEPPRDDPVAPTAPTAPAAPPGAWRAIPVEPVPGASRAAQTPTLAEKRRREAPALPTTPPPMSPAERREALIARERAARSVAPGSVPADDWTDAPLPASAVPPPAVGQAPTPIAVQEGDAPVAHRAYTRPDGEDEDTVWLSRRPSSRAVEPAPEAEPAPPGIPTPISANTSVSLVKTPVTPPPAAATPSFVGPPVTPAPGALRPAATSAWPADPATEAVPARSGSSTGRRLWQRRPIQIGAAALVLVIAIVASFLVWVNRDKPSAAASSQTAAALVERLVAPSQLGGVGPGQWTEQKTESTVTQDSPAPLCFVASPDLPTPTAQAQRKLSATGASLLHRITSYGTSAEASQVYAQRLTQLGQCSNIPVYLTNGATITSLGDDAVGVTAVIQDQTAQYHTVILVRTGSMVLTYDVAQAGAAVTYESILAVAATTVTAVCASAGGGCSASPAAKVGMPPNSAVPGWLTVSDLPRITSGMGRWNATSPKTTVTSAGSACENLTFATVAGPNQRRQRTYLLTEDTKVPKDFGLDEILLDFDTPDAAAAFAAQLKTSITACPSRTATAKLGNTADITATGATGQAVTGFWRTLTQSTNVTTTFAFRVGVATVGTRVIYLLATPSTTFDFTDADWAGVTARAGQRATQGG